MKAYFEAGNSALVLYNGETSSSSGYSIQLRTRDELYDYGNLHRRGGLVPRWRHMEALHGLVSTERRMEAGGSLLQFGRHMGACIKESGKMAWNGILEIVEKYWVQQLCI